MVRKNGQLVTGSHFSHSAWMAYDIQRDDVAVVRTNLLLRTLLIDPEHFHDILHTSLDPATSAMNQRSAIQSQITTFKNLNGAKVVKCQSPFPNGVRCHKPCIQCGRQAMAFKCFRNLLRLFFRDLGG